jgi:hypothetical protein
MERPTAGVLEVTVMGAVPVATVLARVVPETAPVAATLDGVIAPKPMVSAGAGEGMLQLAVTPLFAAAVDTEVTVPLPEEATVSLTRCQRLPSERAV